MEGLNTLVCDIKYHEKLFYFMFENKIFPNFDYVDEDVIYYFKNDFDKWLAEEYLNENVKQENN